MDHAGDRIRRGGVLSQGVHRLARRHVDHGGADLETRVAQNLGCGLRTLGSKVGQQHVLPELTRRAMACPMEPAPMTTVRCLLIACTPSGFFGSQNCGATTDSSV